MESAMRRVILAVLAMLAFGSAAFAENNPSHPIPVIVPFSAGGPSDAMMRIMAERMKTTLGEGILIENVTGAGGKLCVGRTAGSPSASLRRILPERMKTTLGEASLIEKVTGAAGTLGVGRTVRSPPDGY